MAEPVEVGAHEVEGALGSLRQVVAGVLEHFDRRRHRHQRRTKLVGHLRGETCVALDSFLERGGHLVERGNERIEVVVLAAGQSGVELSSGDGFGGETDVA